MLLRRFLARLLAMLRPSRGPASARARGNAAHVSISSFDRRYPGRTPVAELRRNLGWVAVTADHPHRDRRA